MQLALISDIHGNDVAFGEVTADLERVGCDGAVCLGDVGQGGPQPQETLNRLRGLECPVVMGNSDAFLLEVPDDSPEPVTERQLAVREWSLGKLDADDLDFIRSFSPTVELALDGEARLVAFHGSPRSYDDVLLPSSEGPALEPFRGTGAALLAGGHTHPVGAHGRGRALRQPGQRRPRLRPPPAGGRLQADAGGRVRAPDGRRERDLCRVPPSAVLARGADRGHARERPAPRRGLRPRLAPCLRIPFGGGAATPI
ncbi:MAG: metallophosphoesterase family protein [Actinobacteria bacterium]|nr:metallophosphoesterase family protein [Actinomycetota bacterium]